MQQIFIFSAILAVTFAAPGYLGYDVYVPQGKSTLTSSSHVIDHGSTHVLHAPVLAAHEVEYHVPSGKTTVTKSSQVVNHGSTHVLHTPVLAAHEVEYHVPLGKTTVTKSSQIVNHGNTEVVHAPIVHTPVVHAPVIHAPVVSAPVVQAAVYSSYSAPIVTYRTPDSAVSHHSSTVHETLPVVNSLPVYASYH
ncbi:unnamed protein product [Euphydryas editha]|uniref:Cuticle protein n=1 Tax=Euphydryas editha TaxID=104508 RepID=A0AAU9TC35_EUPED|nr:unnamed protein product [Euphydryas editha]